MVETYHTYPTIRIGKYTDNVIFYQKYLPFRVTAELQEKQGGVRGEEVGGTAELRNCRLDVGRGTWDVGRNYENT